MAPSPSEQALIDQELSKRVTALEQAVHAIQTDSAVKHTEIMAEFKAIREFMAQIMTGNSPNCLKESARLTAIELELSKKADTTYAETTRKSLYALYAICSGVIGTLIYLFVTHIGK